ncbi:hypothetical protein [Sulfurospirillum multivorans]|nr:hypothetical protein [Sulfurospirillum multivorans]QEH06593.1 hypothetical protein SMN_1828 [Sulfurospirillum multivorans]
MKKVFMFITLGVCLMASDQVPKQLEVTQRNIDAINHTIFVFSQTTSLGCPSDVSEPMYYRSECVQNNDQAKQDQLIVKIKQAIEYFKKNSIDVLTTKTTNEASSSIFKDADISTNQEATLEASVRFLKDSGLKDYKAVFIAPKVINGKYVGGQIMYGKID